SRPEQTFDFFPFFPIIGSCQRMVQSGIATSIRGLNTPPDNFSDHFGLCGTGPCPVLKQKSGIGIAPMPAFPMLGFQPNRIWFRWGRRR
ncbi:MAG TPA: hypothetical protein VMZ01_03825, partial [Aestuariivirga sp.]|nr:hypothetical protein [Aestuariivirga sp.]